MSWVRALRSLHACAQFSSSFPLSSGNFSGCPISSPEPARVLGQRLAFLVVTKRNAVSGNEIGGCHAAGLAYGIAHGTCVIYRQSQ